MKSLSQYINEAFEINESEISGPLILSFDIVYKSGVKPSLPHKFNESIAHQIQAITGILPNVDIEPDKSINISFDVDSADQLRKWYGKQLKSNILKGVKEVSKSTMLNYNDSIKTLKFS